MKMSIQVLPLTHASRVPPRVPTRILGRPKCGPLMLERLVVSGAGSPGGARDWIVNDIEVDGTSQLSVKDLPGALFGARGVAGMRRHATSAIRFTDLDVIESESEVAVTVTYVGPNPEGVPFYGSVVGEPPLQRPTVLPIATKQPLQRSIKTTISASLDAQLKIEMFEIDCGRDGADWIVNDLRVDDTTVFAQSGDIPGDMFGTRAIDSFVAWKPGRRIEIDVTYIGLEEAGICFVGSIFGTVVRGDYSQPPPDVRAVVRALDQLEEVVARCNWRAPYVRPEPPY